MATGLLAGGTEPGRGPGVPFAVCDHTQGKVFLIGTDGQPTWSYDAPDTNDLWVLPGGNLLFTTGHGVIEVTREKRVVFRYDTSEEIYACHGHLGDAPLVLAITPDKKVARTYENHDAPRTASSVVGLDASPRAPKGLLAH